MLVNSKEPEGIYKPGKEFVLVCFGKKGTFKDWGKHLGLEPEVLRSRVRVSKLPLNVALVSEKDLRLTAEHGTDHMYNKLKCRCDACRSYNTEKFRILRAKKALKNLSK